MTGNRLIRWLTAAVVLAVATFAAVVSYSHIYDLGHAHGQAGTAARLLPLSVDGLILAASLVLLHEARNGRPAPALARCMLWLGIGATVAANVAYGAAYGLLGAVISAWPAVAFIGAIEMVMGMVRRARTAVPGPLRASAPALDGRAHPGSTPIKRTRTAPRTAPVTADDAEREFMADLASGTVPSIRQVRTRMHVGQDRARVLQEHLARLTTATGRSPQ